MGWCWINPIKHPGKTGLGAGGLEFVIPSAPTPRGNISVPPWGWKTPRDRRLSNPGILRFGIKGQQVGQHKHPELENPEHLWISQLLGEF